MQHILAYKLATTYKMTLIKFLINVHINNQLTQYKVNGVVAYVNIHFMILWTHIKVVSPKTNNQ
jgi:hypothetical protein